MDQKVSETFLRKASERVEKEVGKKSTEVIVDEWEKSTGAVKCDKKEWEDRKMVEYHNNRFDFTQLITRTAHRDFTGSKRLGLEKVGGWLYAKGTTLA